MGLLDDEYRGTWERRPANDPVHPWVGLLSDRPRPTDGQRAVPPMPDGAPYPDKYAYPQQIPRIEGERAYRPILRHEDSIPGQREAALMAARRRALEDAHVFRQPKTSAEIGIPDQEPSFQQQLDGMTMGEKLQLLFQNLMGRR